MPQTYSTAPVRYFDGQLALSATDIAADGFGFPWGQSRTYSNKAVDHEQGLGYNWYSGVNPYLVEDTTNDRVAVVHSANIASWFSYDSGSDTYSPLFGSLSSLEHDSGNSQFEFTDSNGRVTVFNDFDTADRAGEFIEFQTEGGTSISVTSTSGDQIIEMQRSQTVDSVTTTDSFLYSYGSSGASEDRTVDVIWRQKVDAGAWTNIRRVVYSYYDGTDSFGSLGDLKSAVTQEWSGSAWSDLGTSYYRYYKSGDTNGFEHGLRYALNPQAFQNLSDDPSVSNPYTASNAIVSLYADYYFEYDADQRVTKETIKGGSQSYTFAYSESSNSDGFNSWKYKTTETLPDTTQKIVYCNYVGQPMLQVVKSGTDEWLSFIEYDSDGRSVLSASPSAISGYDDTYADLLHKTSGSYQFLKNSDGLIRLTEYYTSTGSGGAKGYVKSRKLQHGQTGTPVVLNLTEYTSHSAGGTTIYPVSKETTYTNDDSTGAVVTEYSRTYHSGTVQIDQKTTTLPAIPTSQNGSGTANSFVEVYDADGYLTWRKDERGFITRFKYDIVTGATTQRIDDVDTTQVTDEPTGWTTPTGGGLHLVTDYESDDQGRITQELGPVHSIDLSGTATNIRTATWTVYKDSESRTVVGQGYQKTSDSSFTLVNPVSIVKRDKNGNALEQIQATRASTSGKLLSTDTFAQSSYTRWTTNQYTDCCLLASTRVYHTIPSSGAGTSGTNYDQTDFGYSDMKRRNRTVTPGVTITFVVHDVRGQVEETWIGTDDTGATQSDPSGGGATGNNMVIVTANQYDGGNDGGDGNLTQQTNYATASDTRVTSFAYDWRNRQTAIDGEIDFYQKSYYDNRNRVIKVERYDTTSTGNLISRSETKFDDLGRVYQSIRYAVDPSDGSVGNSLIDNTWYDPSGNVLKHEPAELMTKLEFEYDSLGRLENQTNPLNAQTVFAYDEANNRISLTDAENNTTTWSYDGIGRVVVETNELDDACSFEYDDTGILSVRTDRDGRVFEFDYDDAGRLNEERWKEGTTTVNTLQFTYDAYGNTAIASDDHSDYAYQYDLYGGITEIDNNGTPDVPRVILTAEYNRQVEQTSLSANIAGTNDFLNDHQYDALGRTSRIDQDSNGGNSVAQKRVDFAYEVRGSYETIERYANVSGSSFVAETIYAYDDFHRLTSMDHQKGTTSLASHAYSFNANRLIDQHTTEDGDSDYDYDNAAQLTEALHSFQSNENYSYDLTGNRTITGYSTGDCNRLLSDGSYNYEYDAEGNRTKKTDISTSETVEYTWDHRNRLTKATFKNSSGVKTKEIEYVYDVDNRRIAKFLDSNGNGTVDDEWRYVYDPTVKQELSNVVLVFNGSGNLRNRYLHGPDIDQILADEDASGDVLWQLTDHLGTVRDLIEYDSTADTTSVINHIKYDAFGNITDETDSTKTPFYAFTGRAWDPGAEIFYYRARWYDAVVGRFVTEDPIGFDADDVNLYRYVKNSPVIWGDPNGLKCSDIGGGVTGSKWDKPKRGWNINNIEGCYLTCQRCNKKKNNCGGCCNACGSEHLKICDKQKGFKKASCRIKAKNLVQVCDTACRPGTCVE